MTQVSNRQRHDAPEDGRRPLPSEVLWSAEEVSDFLQVPVNTLYQWRHKSIGPRAFRVGRFLRYDPVIVRAWLTDAAGGADDLH